MRHRHAAWAHAQDKRSTLMRRIFPEILGVFGGLIDPLHHLPVLLDFKKNLGILARSSRAQNDRCTGELEDAEPSKESWWDGEGFNSRMLENLDVTSCSALVLILEAAVPRAILLAWLRATPFTQLSSASRIS